MVSSDSEEDIPLNLLNNYRKNKSNSLSEENLTLPILKPNQPKNEIFNQNLFDEKKSTNSANLSSNTTSNIQSLNASRQAVNTQKTDTIHKNEISINSTKQQNTTNVTNSNSLFSSKKDTSSLDLSIQSLDNRQQQHYQSNINANKTHPVSDAFYDISSLNTEIKSPNIKNNSDIQKPNHNAINNDIKSQNTSKIYNKPISNEKHSQIIKKPLKMPKKRVLSSSSENKSDSDTDSSSSSSSSSSESSTLSSSSSESSLLKNDKSKLNIKKNEGLINKREDSVITLNKKKREEMKKRLVKTQHQHKPTMQQNTHKKHKKTHKSKSSDNNDIYDNDSEDQNIYVTSFNPSTRTRKQKLVAQLLIRWWYALPAWPTPNYDYTKDLLNKKLRCVSIEEWEESDDINEEGLTKVYEISAFPGIFRDPQGNTINLRDEESCPSYKNFMKKTEKELLQLIEKGIKNQLEQLNLSPYDETNYIKQLKKELDDIVRQLRNF